MCILNLSCQNNVVITMRHQYGECNIRFKVNGIIFIEIVKY